jgi:hypothetical protein
MDELPFANDNDRPSGFTWDVESCYDQDGEVRFWPRFTKEILAAILRVQKTYVFSCQYLNRPTAPEGAQFKEEQIKTFRVAENLEDGKRDLIVPSDGSPSVRLKHLSRLSFYDPSSGGKTAKSEGAIVCLGTAPDSRKFAFKVWSANCGFREAVEQWFRLNDQYMTWPNMFEGVGAHKEVSSIVVLRQQEGECSVCKKEGKTVRHRRLSPVCVTPPGGNAQKEDRILTFAQADFEDGRIYLDEQDVATRVQILQFPFGDLLDRFDALAYAIHYSRKPMSVGEAEAQAHERESKQLAKVQRTAQTYDVGGYV